MKQNKQILLCLFPAMQWGRFSSAAMLSNSSYLLIRGIHGFIREPMRSCLGRGDFESDLRRVIKR
jgi:hypothetical protein